MIPASLSQRRSFVSLQPSGGAHRFVLLRSYLNIASSSWLFDVRRLNRRNSGA